MPSIYPGAANVPPPDGYEDANVAPAQMLLGDRLLLGGRIRTVSRANTAHGPIVVIELEPASDADSNVWQPATGDLPVPIWRLNRNAPRSARAFTNGRLLEEDRPTATATCLRAGSDLGPRVVRGIGSIPKTPDDRGLHGEDHAQFPAFERTRPAPAAAATFCVREPGPIVQIHAALAAARATTQADQF